MANRSLIPYVLAIPLALCLLVGAGYGQPPREVQQSVCRIYVHDDNGQGGRSLGSGTLIGKDERTGLVITCWHLFREGRSRISVVFPSGEDMPARLIGEDQANDLAAVIINPPARTEPLPLAAENPAVGSQLFSAGYGSNHTMLINAGAMRGFTASPAAYVLTGTAREGDSGGPVLNERNEVTGVLHHANAEEVVAADLRPINAMLMQCRNGVCQPRYAPRWQEPRQPAIRPVPPPGPQQPPTVPSVPPSGGAAGCQCKGTSACKCDPKAKACACDPDTIRTYPDKIAALEIRICQLEAMLASGKLKGPKGDPGPQGKACEVVSAPVEIIRPDGTKKKLLWPLDGKHGLRLPLNMK